MTSNLSLLVPVIALIAWTLIIWIWMYATRIPAMKAQRIELDPKVPTHKLTEPLPANVRWKADNYNHLMEQPTIFYALILAMVVMGASSPVNVAFAWAYVGLRVAHSLVQVTFNNIMLRFSLFVLSTLALVVLTVNALRFVLAVA